MADFIFLSDPRQWRTQPEGHATFCARMDAAGTATECWSSGSRRYEIGPGDRAWLRKTRQAPLGILASGRIISGVYENPDPQEPNHTVDIAWDPWLPMEDVLQMEEGRVRTAQGCGVQLATEEAARLEMLWEQHPPARASVATRARVEQFWNLVDGFTPTAAAPVAEWKRHDSGNSPSAVPNLLSTTQGPLATALLRCYLDLLDLPDGIWSLSCLPQGPTSEQRRAYTLTIGDIEVFWVWLDLTSGRMVEWHVRIGDPTAPVLARLGIGAQPAHDGSYAVCSDALAFLSLMSDPDGAATLRTGADELANRGAPTRRVAWHNAAFADLVLELASAPNAVRLNYWEDTEEIPPHYALALSWERRHQQRFKQRLLAYQPHACAVCGFDEVELLEAAHLVPDSQGGPSSLANGRLLCPTHHRAHDAGYFRFDGTRVVWDPSRSPFGRPERA